LIHLLIQAGFIVVRKGKNTLFHILWHIYVGLANKKTGYRRTINNPKKAAYFTYISHFSVSSIISILTMIQLRAESRRLQKRELPLHSGVR